MKPSSPDLALILVKFLQKSRTRSLLLLRASESTKNLGLSDTECKTAVVTGKIPKAPHVPPKPRLLCWNISH